MRFLIEAHHPAHIHFWKYPIRELQERGHEALMIGRDRDVMKRLLSVYDWINAETPPRPSTRNLFPLREMVSRQWTVAKIIRRFKPDVVASVMGSYCQSARLFGCRNVIFTDSEFQHFNHRIAHPFADEIHTPECFYKDLGRKQRRYNGIHELTFLDEEHFKPDAKVLNKLPGLTPKKYILVRLSAWNTMHDIRRQGIGDRIHKFINHFESHYRIIVSAEEGKVPPGLEDRAIKIAPEDFHQIVAHSRFVLTEGASTASEAGCLGVPAVFINSTEPRGYLLMLERTFRIVRNFQNPSEGMAAATTWLNSISTSDNQDFGHVRNDLTTSHDNVSSYVVSVLERGRQPSRDTI